jgi:hypothetical protein
VVFAVFPERSSGARAIFPLERRPFQEGTYQQRIEAVHTLSTTLADYTTKPTLVALSAVVLAYYTTMSSVRALQETDEGSTATLRTNLKTALRLLCVALYRDLGLLMAKFAETPLVVADYFDVPMLMRHEDDLTIDLGGNILTGTILNLNPLIEAEGVTLTGTSVIRMRVLGSPTDSLNFYSSNGPFNPPGPGVQFTVNGGAPWLEKTFTEMGFDSFPYFNIQNPSAVELTWEVEIVP